MPSQPTNAGIVTDESSGERHIPESVRADGSTRKAIKIKPGYRPPEDVEVYKNRTAEGFRSRAAKGGVIGAEAASDDTAAPSTAGSAAANKNAKRREARKKAKAAEENGTATGGSEKTNGNSGAGSGENAKKGEGPAEPVLDPEAEREKKARNLKKKLKQARELQDKKEGGQALLPEQIAKVIKINELVRELAALGLDADGEPLKKEGEGLEGGSKEEKAPA
ncbi:rna binding protein [Diaporthe amygdali]|uniref:rna binding protein n=1 Tax=Phomopsis amygdali TaxID=1214568 RepID=UPI0022FE6B92|nr:rna binding protein [Diaporthe amygdali]KAJ0121028.1 rna binding protein [Diaporthe amygdali]